MKAAPTCFGLAIALAALAGCGGSSGPVTSEATPARAARITGPASLSALQAELTKLGKPLPDFLTPGAQVTPAPTPMPGQVQPASYMTTLYLGSWLYSQAVTRKRTQWYEIKLTSWYALTDALVRPRYGDPDLYVFSPLRGTTGDGENSLLLVGYSVRSGYRDDQVGSFITDDFGGPGRFLIAVFGYADAGYKLLVW